MSDEFTYPTERQRRLSDPQVFVLQHMAAGWELWVSSGGAYVERERGPFERPDRLNVYRLTVRCLERAGMIEAVFRSIVPGTHYRLTPQGRAAIGDEDLVGSSDTPS